MSQPKHPEFTKKNPHFLSGNDFECIFVVLGTTANNRGSTANIVSSTANFVISTRGPRWDHVPPSCVFDFSRSFLPHVSSLSQAVWSKAYAIECKPLGWTPAYRACTQSDTTRSRNSGVSPKHGSSSRLQDKKMMNQRGALI